MCFSEQSRAPSPVGYVTAFNPDQSVKDVTKRYVSKWLAYESKVRVPSYVCKMHLIYFSEKCKYRFS